MPDSIRTLDTLELVGGAPCLDFVNTINSRRYPEHDYLRSYSDLVEWAGRAGILTSEQVADLVAHAQRDPEGATSLLHAALTFRDLLHRLFSTLAQHADPPSHDLDRFVTHYAEALSHSQWVRAGAPYTPAWDLTRSGGSLLWPIIYSAGDLLLSPSLSHLKECLGCGWLFLDTSKNQSRRWCSMNTCGARDKMRRYHGKRTR